MKRESLVNLLSGYTGYTPVIKRVLIDRYGVKIFYQRGSDSIDNAERSMFFDKEAIRYYYGMKVSFSVRLDIRN